MTVFRRKSNLKKQQRNIARKSCLRSYYSRKQTSLYCKILYIATDFLNSKFRDRRQIPPLILSEFKPFMTEADII